MSHSNSIREVATRAGVSVGTVSNVLNRPDLVSRATKQRVHEAINDLEFVRNESARQLRAGRSRTLGLMVHSIGNPYFADLARGVDSVATGSGLAVVLCDSDGRAAKEQRYLSLLQEQRVQALLITPIGASAGQLAQMQQHGMAVVLLDHTSRRDDLCSVCVDDVAGGDLVAEHLVAQGHREIAYVAGASRHSQCRDRRDGVLRALRRAGLSDQHLTVIQRPGLSLSEGHVAARRIAGRTPRPTAVFCANDVLALGIMQSLLQQGLKIPEDIALVGYDDIDFASCAAVPLTSVRQPRELLGRTAAELAVNEADAAHEHKHRHVIFQPELVVRESG